MAEATNVSTPKSKKPVVSAIEAFEAPKLDTPKFDTPKFDVPKFEMPKFEMSNMEVPAAFRELAEKGLAQAKENYEKVKSATEQATDVLEDTYSAASKGYGDLGLKMIENARANTNAAFDLYGELLTSKSFAEVVEKSTAYVRVQFESITAQAKELGEASRKVATETAEPIKGSLSSLGKAA